MEKFFAAVYAAILRHLPFQTLRAIVIASPGFTREGVSFDPAWSIRLEADMPNLEPYRCSTMSSRKPP